MPRFQCSSLLAIPPFAPDEARTSTSSPSRRDDRHDDAWANRFLSSMSAASAVVGFCNSMPGAVRPISGFSSALCQTRPGPRRAVRGRGVSQAPAPITLKYPEPTDPVPFPATSQHVSTPPSSRGRAQARFANGHPRTPRLRHTISYAPDGRLGPLPDKPKLATMSI